MSNINVKTDNSNLFLEEEFSAFSRSHTFSITDLNKVSQVQLSDVNALKLANFILTNSFKLSESKKNHKSLLTQCLNSCIVKQTLFLATDMKIFARDNISIQKGDLKLDRQFEYTCSKENIYKLIEQYKNLRALLNQINFDELDSNFISILEDKGIYIQLSTGKICVNLNWDFSSTLEISGENVSDIIILNTSKQRKEYLNSLQKE